MATYKAPLKEIGFVLDKVLAFDQLSKEIPAFAEVDTETCLGLVDEAAKFIENTIAPLNASGDAEGCRYKDGENWKHGDDVIIVPAVNNDDAKKLFPNGWNEVKPYLRIVPQPGKA